MKIRNGFVSNSSSASFVIKFSSTLPRKEVEKYIYKSSKYLEKYWAKDIVEERESWSDILNKNPNPKMEKHVYKAMKRTLKRKENVYSLDESMTMFNDWMDANVWQFVRAISENRIPGFKLEEIIQTEDQLEDMHNKVEFDPLVWETHNDKNSSRQRKIEAQYIQYLIDVLGESEELKVQLATYLLSS